MKVTNAEKIRSMTDEELAMMLMCPAEYSLEFSKTSECNGGMDRNCMECTLRWLRKQAD